MLSALSLCPLVTEKQQWVYLCRQQEENLPGLGQQAIPKNEKAIWAQHLPFCAHTACSGTTAIIHTHSSGKTELCQPSAQPKIVQWLTLDMHLKFCIQAISRELSQTLLAQTAPNPIPHCQPEVGARTQIPHQETGGLSVVHFAYRQHKNWACSTKWANVFPTAKPWQGEHFPGELSAPNKFNTYTDRCADFKAAGMFWGMPGMWTQHMSFQPLPAITCPLSWVSSWVIYPQAALFLTGDKVQPS